MLLSTMTIVWLILIFKQFEATNAHDYDDEGFVCPENWIRNYENGVCYYFSDHYASYKVAYDDCVKRSASLANIVNSGERSWIEQQVKEYRRDCSSHENCVNFWVALTYRNPDSPATMNWTWSIGREAFKDLKNWQPYLSFVGPKCGSMEFKIHNTTLFSNFAKQSCEQPLKYICKKVMKCPKNYTLVPGAYSCYRLVSNVLPWQGAILACQQQIIRGHLAMITNQAESEAVTKYLHNIIFENRQICTVANAPGERSIWIGGQRANPSSCQSPFVWKPVARLNSSLHYTNWDQGQPNCGPADQHCMYVDSSSTYKWNDGPCITPRCFLCESHQ